MQVTSNRVGLMNECAPFCSFKYGVCYPHLPLRCKKSCDSQFDDFQWLNTYFVLTLANGQLSGYKHFLI